MELKTISNRSITGNINSNSWQQTIDIIYYIFITLKETEVLSFESHYDTSITMIPEH